MNQVPNTVSITDAKKHLNTVLGLFRKGETEPLIFGAEGKPEAVIIPYAQFQRLVRYDAQAFREDQVELARRKKDSGDNPDDAIEFDAFVQTLDPGLRARLRKEDETD